MNDTSLKIFGSSLLKKPTVNLLTHYYKQFFLSIFATRKTLACCWTLSISLVVVLLFYSQLFLIFFFFILFCSIQYFCEFFFSDFINLNANQKGNKSGNSIKANSIQEPTSQQANNLSYSIFNNNNYNKWQWYLQLTAVEDNSYICKPKTVAGINGNRKKKYMKTRKRVQTKKWHPQPFVLPTEVEWGVK